MYKKIIIFLALIWIFGACQNRPLQQLGATAISQKVEAYQLGGGGTLKVDILFVVDNSTSMREEQEKIAENIGNFMKMLQISADAGKTDYQIGIITTSVYDKDQTNRNIPQIKNNEDGRLLTIKTDSSNLGECNNNELLIGAEPKKFLTNTDNTSEDRVVKLLQDTILCAGINGSGIERGLDAIERALSPLERSNKDTGYNKGFLRDDAKLMIIVIGDEDDCSTGLRAIDSNEGPFPIDSNRGFDCVEQSYLITEAVGQATGVKIEDKETQNKLKPVSEYYNFLLELKKGDAKKLGFAAIVGPLNCWTGEINDMGQGPQGSSSEPFPFLNCEYGNEKLTKTTPTYNNTRYEENFSTCSDGVVPICECTEDSSKEFDRYNCKRGSELFATCFNDLTGRPNRLPIISQEYKCSENNLHGYCSNDNEHCEVTDVGVRCVPNTCSSENINGTCRADQTCDNGICIDKVAAIYDTGANNIPDTPDDLDQIAKYAGYSQASPGARFLELQKLVEEGNPNDSYKYAICLEDFGTPLSLIGARLADSKCEYKLKSRTDDPCTIAIKIFEEGKPVNNTSLNSPWTYTTLPDHADKTGEELVRICRENLSKPFSERIDISQYLEKVACNNAEDGKKECLKILFPDSGDQCPQPGSDVEIYYGVNE